jgi:hypothetical protein
VDARLGKVLELPRIGPPPKRTRATKVLVDYSKSIILTREEYITMMEAKERRKEAALNEKEARRIEAERKKREREATKFQKEVNKAQRLVDV